MARARAAITLSARARRFATAVAVLSLAVAFVVFYAAWSAFVVNTATSELSRQVRAIASGIEASGGIVRDISQADEVEQVRERLFRVEAGLMGAGVVVVDEAGEIVRTSADDLLPLGSTFPLDRLGDADEDGVRVGRRTSEAGGTYVLVAAPVDESSNAAWVIAARPLREIIAAQRWIVGLLAASLLAALVIAWVIGGMLARRMTRPLVDLRDTAEAMASGEWGVTVPEEGDDEIRSLARSFNRMSERVTAAYRAQKAFVADVSHEIRTPITSIRGFSEALLDGTASDPAIAQESLEIIRDESRRLADLAITLLSLADLDAGVVEFSREPIDPARVFAALRARHAESARQAGVELEIVEPPADLAWPEADEDRVVQAASALVNNAITHTPNGGTVRVSASIEGDRWCLGVDDSGPGVPVEHRDSVFARFSRLDRSRSSRSGGHGLGLPICRSIVERMDGTVTVDASDLSGARFVIALPRSLVHAGNSTQTQR